MPASPFSYAENKLKQIEAAVRFKEIEEITKTHTGTSLKYFPVANWNIHIIALAVDALQR